MDNAGICWILFFTLSVFFMTSIAVFLTRGRNRRAELMKGAAPVVVTSATHTAPGGYQVTAIPATTYQPTTYSTPYPAQTAAPNITVQMPMPMPSAQPPMPGMQPHVAPYPPAQQFPGAGGANMSPPSYDAAMANSAPSVVPAGYEKQMPYNPNY
ncbi:actin cytoskeleton-regulatory complex protein PAN1 isoform X5 [Drosophila innubila]|uniref:actin cytoskeleton-regulatory complex protein PAN1 isoform X5 n=1 Tax=Drosophila innubila TaxID=198719 RepID=UPI00148B85D3|nr:actin cytoskeleton-regulatory complex protein PAN1 isoform X5 [Drosophila innubila]